MADWNWRDEFEEKTDHGATVLVVVKDGDRHIGLAKDNDGCVFSVQGSLICKPKPKKYRPWTRDEVPVGSAVRNIANGSRHVILSAEILGSHLGGTAYHGYQLLFERFTLLDDSPCGVEE